MNESVIVGSVSKLIVCPVEVIIYKVEYVVLRLVYDLNLIEVVLFETIKPTIRSSSVLPFITYVRNLSESVVFFRESM